MNDNADVNQSMNPEPAGDPSAAGGREPLGQMDLSPAALLRVAADGEDDLLSDRQRAELKDLLASDAGEAFVGNERAMRASVGRAFAGDAAAGASARLRDRVAAVMADETLDLPAPVAMAPQTRNPSFWTRGLATLAVAAAVGIAAVSVFTSGVGGPGGPAGGLQAGGTSLQQVRALAAGFVSQEHGRCNADVSIAEDKQRVVDAAQLPGLVRQIMGLDLSLHELVFSSDADVEFVRGGRCGVPGGGPSMHLSFETQGSASPVSLFVQEDMGELGLDTTKTYTFGGACGDEGPAVYVWASRGLVFYLVTDNDIACDPLLEGHNAPGEMVRLTDAL